MLLLSFLATLAFAIIWKIGDKIDNNKIAKQAHEFYHNTNYDRQQELYAYFKTTGKDLQGNDLTEPHWHPKEIQRLVKKQLEAEGIRYINDLNWNLDHCVFDKEGNIVSVAGNRVDRLTGRYII